MVCFGQGMGVGGGGNAWKWRFGCLLVCGGVDFDIFMPRKTQHCNTKLLCKSFVNWKHKFYNFGPCLHFGVDLK